MTRESKIGLLVGLGFIIVIGILLSEHVARSSEPLPAALAEAGPAARLGSAAPGIGFALAPPAVAASVGQPVTVVPTPGELRAEFAAPAKADMPPVVILAARESAATPGDGPADLPVIGPASGVGGAVSTHMDDAPGSAGRTITPRTGPPASGVIEYVAQPGDSLSRLAVRSVGNGGEASKQAILDLNPSLRADPDRVLVGATYLVPAGRSAAIAPRAQVAASKTYTVQSGDSLWRIAQMQVGDASAVGQIKSLNADVLRGSDTVHPGMTLRLP